MVNKQIDCNHGYIYFIVDYDKREVKVGYSKHPQQRLKELKTSNSGNLVLTKIVPETRTDEKKYHKIFCHSKIRREWFKLTPEIEEFINRQAA
jgi:hypothetical protein